ncbi:molybdenum ABC transporter ATP-binding protein [Vibrio ulleungensis]|uniref:Molybdenum ABC transporter ATP-binding protein n=1 Tax=Vibrio ulleungensis TaxID=2807619 RepID=A0ABS2HGW3_9VIBR|nr:molybdenum ABC transporter ATP-binding protein [Vibrio ulleungensis]MBM7035707.1 molybdenum ABC transporter ATP-binding protein [Vibrio ulleungensis]
MISIRFNHRFSQKTLSVDFSFPQQGITALFGRSGSGKTTIANILSGLMLPEQGRVILGEQVLLDTDKGICIPSWARSFGVVFQEHRLFPHLSVRRNLLFSKHAMSDKLNEISSLLGIEELLDLTPSELSGGEQQRVAIGRCLLSDPSLIIMDEPLSSLDLPRRRELIEYLRKLHQSIKIPILYITHSMSEIVQLADYMVVVDDGAILTQGAPSEVIASNALSAWNDHNSQSSLLVGKVSRDANEFGFVPVTLPNGQAIWINDSHLTFGENARVKVDANNVSLSLEKPVATSIRNSLHGQVIDIVINDNGALVKISFGQDSVLWANVSIWALDELAIIKGQWIFAQIKAVSVERYDVAALGE